ncbi:MAG: hypothetical protein AB1635_15700 [Acidobacteriota bacterium]
MAAFVVGSRTAGVQAATAFTPARHERDEWLDKLPGKHRVILDAVTATGASEAIGFATNIYLANKADYGLEEKDIALIVCLRHFATVFAFTDPIWAKHGKALASAVRYTDPRSSEPPVVNPYNSAPRSAYDTLAKRGAHFAICDMATNRFARMLAGPDGDQAAVYKELRAHAIPNAHFVAAGVVGVTRAQEYGYSVLHVG